MDYQNASIIIIVTCLIVLGIGMTRKRTEWFVNFILRAIVGIIAIFVLNAFFINKGISVKVGINVISLLTSGILGIPGIAVLYGINYTKFL